MVGQTKVRGAAGADGADERREVGCAIAGA
jgi:hypothetical protein